MTKLKYNPGQQFKAREGDSFIGNPHAGATATIVRIAWDSRYEVHILQRSSNFVACLESYLDKYFVPLKMPLSFRFKTKLKKLINVLKK